MSIVTCVRDWHKRGIFHEDLNASNHDGCDLVMTNDGRLVRNYDVIYKNAWTAKR